MRGTCLAASRFKSAAVDVVISVLVVCFERGRISFFFVLSTLLRAHTAYCVYQASLPHLPLYYKYYAYAMELFMGVLFHFI